MECECSNVISNNVEPLNRNIYHVNFWKEVKRRWMVLGVLVVVALAVIAPRIGAPGGPLHTEYLCYLPLSYIYFAAGRSRASTPRARLCTLTVLHANLGALVVCTFTVNAMAAALDSRVVEGVMLASAARPCAWLPVSLLSCRAVPTLAAVNYAVSLVVSPLVHFFLCGRVPIPPLEGVLYTLLTTLAPFALGHFSSKPTSACGTSAVVSENWSSKLSALLVLYAECCALLREAEGTLYLSDVLATLFLAVWWVVGVAGSGVLYARGGLLSAAEARTLLLVATPKATHIGWLTPLCTPAGLARLPAVFLAPAQALLLSALTDPQERLPG